MGVTPEMVQRVNSAARLAKLREQYPVTFTNGAPPDIGNPPGKFTPYVDVTMRHVVARSAAEDKRDGRVFPVDSLFPATVRGRADTSGIDEGGADLLYGLVRALQPRVVLETGTHKGRSTRALATALRDNAHLVVVPYVFTVFLTPGHCWTVDAEDHHILTSGAIPEDAQSFVTPILGFTPDVFVRPPLDGLTGIDFAFLDGDHSAEGLDAELQYVDQHRASECWVVVDNSRDDYWSGVKRTLHDYTKYPRVSLATMCGMDVIWMKDDARSPRVETANGGAGS